MEIDQQSSSSSSSTTASVPAALASCSQHMTTVTVSSSNVQQNGFKNIVNGNNQRDGSDVNSAHVLNGNINITTSPQK